MSPTLDEQPDHQQHKWHHREQDRQTGIRRTYSSRLVPSPHQPATASRSPT